MSRSPKFDDGRKFVQYASCDDGGLLAALPVDADKRQRASFARWCEGHDRVGEYDQQRGNAMEPCTGTVTVHTNPPASFARTPA